MTRSERPLRSILFLFLLLIPAVSSCQSLPRPSQDEPPPPGTLTPHTFIENARQGNLAAVKSFLAAGIDPNVRDDEGGTALIAAVTGNQGDIVKLLLDKGADVNAKNKNGETALFWAPPMEGAGDVIRLLLEKGADTNIESSRGITPVMNAASKRQVDVVKILIESGADINRKNKENIGALGLAARANSMEIVHLLMTRGVAFSSEDAGEVLTMAALRGRHDVIDFFKGRGVSIDTFDGTGNNALIWAIGGGRVDVVEFLLRKGANPNIRNAAGMTALMLAAAGGSPEIVEALVENGADVNARARGGVSGLGLAGKLKKVNPEVVEILKKAGATE